MTPTIHLVRHAQGFHNLSHAAEQIHDPSLTPLGEQQCANLRAAFPHHAKLTKLLASPMRRTVYTCINAFGRDDLPPIIALPEFQEISHQPCDVGSPVPKVSAEFAGKADYSHVEETWCEKGVNSPYEPTLEKLLARGKKGRLTLREAAGNGDDHILLVTHGGFLHFMTDDWQGVDADQATGWLNCEYRSYQFVDPTGKDEEAALRETDESWTRRQGSTIPLTATEQRELRPLMIEKMGSYLHLINGVGSETVSNAISIDRSGGEYTQRPVRESHL
ncbi:histidine phosphatase superfamily [Dactylonectria macrodidyma]|uniref:Histidine phosphatase superfamily n=1 Tax=Dactylonectria macrodidyma TaxID=307937 RepID=A0A9P9JJF4_9HYPO|nr:histidine phosphatase superfamily [Dactylonectria macrodidyma]